MLTTLMTNGYADLAGAKSSVDLGGSRLKRRISAPLIVGAFFVPAMRYGGCARDAFGHAGLRLSRSANLRTVAPIRCLAASGDDSISNGVIPMAKLRLFLTPNPSKRAAAHRAMAKAALFADTSASTRLKRYNHHIEKARHLEAAVSGLEVCS
ncbi:MAG: hypothetical protein ACTIJ4_15310 [Halomonas sp.]|nr:hypothetical protein [Halomonas casei]